MMGDQYYTMEGLNRQISGRTWDKTDMIVQEIKKIHRKKGDKIKKETMSAINFRIMD
jgi:hypothetical protein